MKQTINQHHGLTRGVSHGRGVAITVRGVRIVVRYWRKGTNDRLTVSAPDEAAIHTTEHAAQELGILPGELRGGIIEEHGAGSEEQGAGCLSPMLPAPCTLAIQTLADRNDHTLRKLCAALLEKGRQQGRAEAAETIRTLRGELRDLGAGEFADE